MENIMTIELTQKELYLNHIAEWRSEKEHTAYEHLVFLIKRNELRKEPKGTYDFLEELRGAFSPCADYRGFRSLRDLLWQARYSMEFGDQADTLYRAL